MTRVRSDGVDEDFSAGYKRRKVVVKVDINQFNSLVDC